MENSNNIRKDGIREKLDKVDIERISKRNKKKEIIRNNKRNKGKKYDVFIAYRQGAKKENIEKIIPVYNRLTNLGYEVYFDIEDKDQGTNEDKNLSYLMDSRIILVFLDSSVKSLKETDCGFYKEIQLLPKRDKTDDILVYRYNGYESVDDVFLAERGKYTFLDEGSELYRSADLVVRDVEYKLHRYWPQTFKQWKKTKKRLFLPAGISFIFVILLALFAYNQIIITETNKKTLNDIISAYSSKERMLLISGGSTVKNYIDSLNPTFAINYYPNSVYVNMGSEAAWRLLVEDFMIDSANRKYYPVVLSAGKLDIKLLKDKTGFVDNKSCVEYDRNRRIEEFPIGTEDLIVELSPRKAFREYENKKTISVDGLLSLILRADSNVTLYTTSSTSGTLVSYKKIISQHLASYKDNMIHCKDSTMLENKLTNAVVFTPQGFRGKNNKIILTSQSYTSDEKNSIRLKIVDKYNNTYKKYLYIYSIRIHNNSGSYTDSDYIRPKPVDRFYTMLKEKTGVTEDSIKIFGLEEM